MKVKILNDDPNTGVKKGEIYQAQRYPLDETKVMLLARIPDGYDPECNEYLYNVEVSDE